MSVPYPIPSPVVRSGVLRHEGVVAPRTVVVSGDATRDVPQSATRSRRRRGVVIGLVVALIGVFAWAETPDARSSAPTSKASVNENARDGAATKTDDGPANLSFLLYGPLGPKVDGIKLNPYAAWQAAARPAPGRRSVRTPRASRARGDMGVMRKVDDPKPNPYY